MATKTLTSMSPLKPYSMTLPWLRLDLHPFLAQVHHYPEGWFPLFGRHSGAKESPKPAKSHHPDALKSCQ